MSTKEHTASKRTYTLKLTKFELTHIRDLFSIKLPPDLGTTVSQALAQAEERGMVEAALWQKIVGSCTEANVPLEDDAPDFIVAASAPPPIGVFQLAHEPNQGVISDDEGLEENDGIEVDVFSGGKQEEEQAAPVKRKKAKKKAKKNDA